MIVVASKPEDPHQRVGAAPARRAKSAPFVQGAGPRIAVDHVKAHLVVAARRRLMHQRLDQLRADPTAAAGRIDEQPVDEEPPVVGIRTQRGHRGHAPCRADQAVAARQAGKPACHEGAARRLEPGHAAHVARRVARAKGVVGRQRCRYVGQRPVARAQKPAQFAAERLPVEAGDPVPFGSRKAAAHVHVDASRKRFCRIARRGPEIQPLPANGAGGSRMARSAEPGDRGPWVRRQWPATAPTLRLRRQSARRRPGPLRPCRPNRIRDARTSPRPADGRIAS